LKIVMCFALKSIFKVALWKSCGRNSEAKPTSSLTNQRNKIFLYQFSSGESVPAKHGGCINHAGKTSDKSR
jgi:hypothetical protein